MSPIIVKRAKRRSRLGFTLIELLLVSALLVLLAAVVFPRMSGPVRSRGIEYNAEDFANFVRFGRREAVRLQQVLTLHISPDGDRYWLSRAVADVGGGRPDRFFDVETSLSNGIAIDEIRSGDERVTVRKVDFSPSGAGPEISFRLQDGEGRKKYVVLGAWLDQVAVVDELQGEPREG